MCSRVHILEKPYKPREKVALGRRIGLYKFCGDIGRGNFSKVKLAVHQLTRDKVAIKVVDRGGLDARALRMLSREVATLECVHHPNVLRLFEVVETLGRVYLVTEWVKGGELYTHITQGGPLREIHAAPLYKQLLLAVKHMHSLGFVHRDIKAENVLLVSESMLKLADFGFSTELINGPTQKLDTFCGSPPYAAPELFSDDHYMGQPVDVWALGVLLYFMVVGNMPFRAPTVPALRSAVLKGDYFLPSHISVPCARLIQRILVHTPGRRPTIDEILSSQWIINPNIGIELMQQQLNQLKPKKSSFWFRTKSRRITKSYSLRERYMELMNKPALQLNTKRNEGILVDNFLHPIEVQHQNNHKHNFMGNGTTGTSDILIVGGNNSGSTISGILNNDSNSLQSSTLSKKSFFGGTTKKKIGPMETSTRTGATNKLGPLIDSKERTHKSGELRRNTIASMNNDIEMKRGGEHRIVIEVQSTFKNYDEERGEFIMLPTDTDDYVKLSRLETEAREILEKLGITSAMLQAGIKNGPRSELIGAYRIIIYRLQKQAWLAKKQAEIAAQEPPKIPKRARTCTIL